MNPVPVDLSRHGALEQTNRNHQAKFSLNLLKNTFDPFERPTLNDNLLADLQKRPRCYQQTRLCHGAYVLYFVLGDGRRGLPQPNQADNTRSGEHGQSMFDIEAAKNIARKQKLIEALPTVGPATLSLVAKIGRASCRERACI